MISALSLISDSSYLLLLLLLVILSITSPRLFCLQAPLPWDSPGKNTGGFLLRVFPTRMRIPALHWQGVLYHWSQHGKPTTTTLQFKSTITVSEPRKNKGWIMNFNRVTQGRLLHSAKLTMQVQGLGAKPSRSVALTPAPAVLSKMILCMSSDTCTAQKGLGSLSHLLLDALSPTS